MDAEDTSRAVEACRQCAAAASQCASIALAGADSRAMSRCVQLAMDCAAVCRLVVSAALRRSKSASVLQRACVLLCEELADECAKYTALHCRRCAVACRYTARACRAALVGRTDGSGALPAVV